ncbi:Voltage-dependent anion channel-forming protein YneE/VCCN1/2-like protein, partial [Pleurotus pulmonarius]
MEGTMRDREGTLTDIDMPGQQAQGFKGPDPFAPREQPAASIVNAFLATAFYRCWHILLFYGAWATMVTVLGHTGHDIIVQPTLLTVVGTVLGFVISYRTTSSFERYNEGRRLWSQIMIASRSFARVIWFHVPGNPPPIAVQRHIPRYEIKIDTAPPTSGIEIPADEERARSTIEKKTAINLLEAFAVAIKHYLRNEDGIYYRDLYYLVKFLPEYALPAGRPSETDLSSPPKPDLSNTRDDSTLKEKSVDPPQHLRSRQHVSAGSSLPFSATTSSTRPHDRRKDGDLPLPLFRRTNTMNTIIPQSDEIYLLPGNITPNYYILTIFPFSLLDRVLTRKSSRTGKRRAELRNKAISHNIPLEISLYLSSYVAALQRRHTIDVPTTNSLLLSLGQLVDSLTGLQCESQLHINSFGRWRL